METQAIAGNNIGDSHATVVQKKQRGRAERQFLRNEDKVQGVRRAKAEARKLFLCDARYPITNHFCIKEFLSKVFADASCSGNMTFCKVSVRS